jgi:hypothetical protein
MGDLSNASLRFEAGAPPELDALIDNLELWKESAFTSEYSFLENTDTSMINRANVIGTDAIVLVKRLVPKLLRSPHPRVILTGSTSGLRRS